MSLLIRQFATTCYVPRSRQDKAPIVDELARGRFATDLAAHLGPSLSRQPAIVRIRNLSLRVIVPDQELTADALSRVWAEALLKALFTALQYPSGAGRIEIFRAESTSVYVSGVIRDLLEGVAGSRWYYEEFEDLFQLGNTPAALALLCRWSDHTMPILFDLARTGDLDRFLSRVDDPALERVFFALSQSEPHSSTLTFADILEAVRLAVSNPPRTATIFRTRRYALQQFVDARRNGQWMHSAATLFQAFRTIWCILTEGITTLTGAPPVGEFQTAESLQSPELRQSVEVVAAETHGNPQSPQFAEWTRALDQLRLQVNLPSPPAEAFAVRWIASEWVGLFFLTSTLENTHWISAWKRLGDFERGGVSCLIAGIALSIAERFEPGIKELDRGLALFAGFDEEPDFGHLRDIFAAPEPEVRRRVLEAAFDAPPPEAAASWPATFHLLAGELIQRFASSLRGFRQASRPGIVHTFLKRPGRITLSENCIVAVPDPSPYHVVLHIAGLDAPIYRVSWMGDRRLEFEVGDL